MSKFRELLKLAQDCYALTKRALVQMGDDRLKDADKLKRGQTVVQTAFPKPDI
jgi:hypothetical protein